MTTIYEYNNEQLFTDDTDAYQIEDIQAHYSQHFTELTQATYTVISPEKDGDPRRVIFAKKIGIKGGDSVVSRLVGKLRPKEIAAFTLLRDVEQDSSPENLLRLAPAIEAALYGSKRMETDCKRILKRCLTLSAIPTPRPPHGF